MKKINNLAKDYKMIVAVFSIILILASGWAFADDQNPIFSEFLYNSVYAIVGYDGTFGTTLFIACPVDSSSTAITFITARHVLDSIKTDSAKILFRAKSNQGDYEPVPHTIQIRRNGKRLYKVHPDTAIDLAGMRTTIPNKCKDYVNYIPKSCFATDKDVEKYWIHPGDMVFFLGFPLFSFSPKSTFPLLRSGSISSFPIIPFSENPLMLVDAPVFEGNSGGPVFFEYNPIIWNKRTFNADGKILGIMTTYSYKEFKRKIGNDSTAKIHDLYLGGVVTSNHIFKFFELLKCAY